MPYPAMPDDHRDEYRLLSALMERPLHPMAALEKAGLLFGGQCEPTDAQRTLLFRMKAIERTIRVVTWAGGGYVVTGIGEARLSTLEQMYGPLRAPE